MDTIRLLTGYPLHYKLPGKPGLGGYFGVSRIWFASSLLWEWVLINVLGDGRYEID